VQGAAVSAPLELQQRSSIVKPQLTESDHIFDGFAHRNFNEAFDGWRNRMPDANDYLSVRMANDILDLFDSLCQERRRVWELEQELKLWKRMPS